MKELEELFLHELKDMYDAEQRLVDTLPKVAKDSTDPEIRQAFEHHLEETEGQVERLRQAFKALGKRPQAEPCAGMRGLVTERNKIVRELSPEPHVLDVINLGAAQKVERYEITAYESLIQMAGQLGHDDVAELLRESLMEEEKALETVRSLAEEFDVEAAAKNARDEAPRRIQQRDEEGGRTRLGKRNGRHAMEATRSSRGASSRRGRKSR